MNLSALIRSIVVLVIGWTVVALGIGMLGPRSSRRAEPFYFMPIPSHHDAIAAGSTGFERQRLVDRTTGRSELLQLPGDEQWGLLGVSPWCDRRGDLQAVGRWVNRDEPSFCGLGLIRLPEGTVLERISLEIPPIGRPCWIPGRSDAILFPAGDGQLYRYEFSSRSERDGIDTAGPRGHDGTEPPRAVTWECPLPGAGYVFLDDPVWSPDPRLKNRIIVALRRPGRLGRKDVLRPSELWWLEMNDEADAIMAAGRLTKPADGDTDAGSINERSPNVAVDRGGKIRLVYLARPVGQAASELRSVELEFDPGSGEPRVVGGEGATRVLGEGLPIAPLLVSADGLRVFAYTGSDQVTAFSIPTEIERSTVAENRSGP